MGRVLTTTAGHAVWIVLWAIGWKPFDGFILACVLIMFAATARILARYLPDRE